MMSGFLKKVKYKGEGGMTFIEVIIVISIFSILSAISFSDYRVFQSNVDIRNLASDIGLKLTEAQRSALTGRVAPPGYVSPLGSSWKPAYGLYFKIESPGANQEQKRFVYFVDLDNDGQCSGCDTFPASIPSPVPIGYEVLEVIDITKGNYISRLKVGTSGTSYNCTENSLESSVVFTRPDSRGTIRSLNPSCFDPMTGTASILGIFINAPSGAESTIISEHSGRVYFQ